MKADVIVIGGGIVGLATAMSLIERYPGIAVTVVEKEAALAAHQTGHNSGVIHAGVYYQPGSMKARFCKEGAAATYNFSREHGLPFEQCGKLIVATNQVEEDRLEALYTRCLENGLDPQRINKADLASLEPRICGNAAVLVQSSGIADYPAITHKMAEIVAQSGGRIVLDAEVKNLSESGVGVVVEAGEHVMHAKHAIVCAGLAADRLMRMCGLETNFRIVPFRGEYYRLPESKNHIVSHLVYPVPNPELPFLGVHLTRMIDGYVTVGPNAVLALAREGYRWRDISPRDLLDMACFPGFWKVVKANARSGATEMRNSIFRKGYLAECQKYCPELTLQDLEPHPAGVRAQAVLKDGTLVHDFLIHRGRRSLHVCNAPSPAATSAIPIGRYLVEQFDEIFGRDMTRTPTTVL